MAVRYLKDSQQISDLFSDSNATEMTYVLKIDRNSSFKWNYVKTTLECLSFEKV